MTVIRRLPVARWGPNRECVDDADKSPRLCRQIAKTSTYGIEARLLGWCCAKEAKSTAVIWVNLEDRGYGE